MMIPLLPSERFPGCWISDEAIVETGTEILPGTVIGAGVRIGNNNVIGPQTVIVGNVHVGDGNVIMPGVVIGMPSRQRIRKSLSPIKPSEAPRIRIGSDNILHEGVTVRLPMQDVTQIDNWVAIGAKSHVANDCVIRSHALVAANCSFGGYVTIGTAANVGLGVAVHPRTVVGAYAMCGVGAAVVRHVLPGATVGGVPARYMHVNTRGLERNGFSTEEITDIERVFNGSPIDAMSGRIVRLLREFENDMRVWERMVGTIPAGAIHWAGD